MSRIFVDFSGFNNMSESCKRVSSNIDTIQIDFKNTVHNLDWDIRFQGTCHSHPAFLPLRAHCILDRIESRVILKGSDK